MTDKEKEDYDRALKAFNKHNPTPSHLFLCIEGKLQEVSREEMIKYITTQKEHNENR